MNPLLARFFRDTIRKGALEVVDSGGALHAYGDGSGTPIRMRFTNPRAERNVILRPALKFGEEFMDGGYRFEAGSLYDFLDLVYSNIAGRRYPIAWMKGVDAARFVVRRLGQMNGRFRAPRNIAHHYDLDAGLYPLFLDDDLQYSCAFFATGRETLEEAQAAKKQRIAAKLALSPGMRVLDIGCGFGGLGLDLAAGHGADVTGVTLSREQVAVATRRAAERGLAGRARFLLQDYRDAAGPFDRIVSVGMFEHVGVARYGEFFARCRDLLAPDGVMLLHSIGRFDGPQVTNRWIQKYIFPGGYIPALSEVLPAVERSGLKATDVEILRLHYARTLRIWRERFLANRDRAKALYDERFCRMWEFYLSVAEMSFHYQNLMNFQLQLARHQEALPFARDYMQEGAGVTGTSLSAAIPRHSRKRLAS